MQDTESKELALFTLEPRQQRLIQLYLTGNFTIAKMAELLDVHPNTVSKWLKRTEIRKAIDEAQYEIYDQVSVQLKSMTVKATEKLNKLIDSPMDAIALQAVKDVLDRGGHKTKNEIKVEKTVVTMEQKLSKLIDATVIEAEMEEIE